MKKLLLLLALTAAAQAQLVYNPGTGGGGGGSGTVTSVATTGPISGGTITTTGTISCPTCTTNASALTSSAFVTGAGGQASQTPSATSTLDASGNAVFAGSVSTGTAPTVCGTATGCFGATEGTASNMAPVVSQDACTADAAAHGWKCTANNGTVFLSAMNLIQPATGTIAASFASAPGGSKCLHTNGITGAITEASADCTAGTVTSAVIAGTANQITASGTCTITSSGTCTLSLVNGVILGTDNSAAGTLQLANSAANAHTIWGSGATTSNTINGFATVPTTGHLIDCTVSSTTCLLHDSGVVTANVVNASSPGVGIAHFAGSTQAVTSSLIVAADITNATITGTQLASSLALTGTTSLTLIGTATKCAASDSSGTVSCSAAPSGSFSCGVGRSGSTCIIATTAVTANSAIFVQPDSSLGTLLSVTCTTTADTGLTAPRVSARSANTSFTITLGIYTNSLCFNYWVIN